MDLPMRRSLWARSLLLQSCWNFERMQNLGLAYALEPWLRRLYPEPGARLAALSRHQDFFNTNPYTAPLIMGMVCALEEEAAGLPEDARQEKLARISALKKASAPPLAGLGDALFWQTLRPFCAAGAITAALCLWKLAGLAAALVGMASCYLLVYNMAAWTLRWRGLRLGYEWRERIATNLKGYPWQAWIKRLRLGGTVLAAVPLISVFIIGRGERAVAFLALLLCLIADRVTLKAVSPVRLYAGAGVLGAAASLAGWL